MAKTADFESDLDDSAMLAELKGWMGAAREAIAGHPKLRHAEIELHKINGIAEQLKAQVRERLSGLEDRYGSQAEGQAMMTSRAAAFAKADARLEAYLREQQAIVAEFAERNEKLWRQRMVLTRDVLAAVERHETAGVAVADEQRAALQRISGVQDCVSGGLMERLGHRAKERSEEASQVLARQIASEQGPEPEIN